jgi:hypothetical protein
MPATTRTSDVSHVGFCRLQVLWCVLALGALLGLAMPRAVPAQSLARTSLSVRITSPHGRLASSGAIRIVAQVSHPANVALGAVRFYVNDALVGDDNEGPPYAVEWMDANPFEPARIRVDAFDTLGNSVSDAVELAPFEILEAAGVSRVMLEATVTDKADRFVGGLSAASFRV